MAREAGYASVSHCIGFVRKQLALPRMGRPHTFALKKNPAADGARVAIGRGKIMGDKFSSHQKG